MVHDLLTDPLLSWRDTARHRQRSNLPAVLTALAGGDLGDFPRLRTHQLHPWCMFLTQLAALALRDIGQADPRLSEDAWRNLLLRLTGGRHEPWTLLVEDLSQPAFFQPPVPEATIVAWPETAHPDRLDLLITAKGHDVKGKQLRGDDPELWIYALTTLQTMQGFPGRGYTRISRMKGGFGNRPRVGLSPDASLGARFLRDVAVLLDSASALVARRGYRDDGIALTWIEPWNGRGSLPADHLAPHFIEICWRVRCVASGHDIVCRYTTTTDRRCLPESKDGDIGDPWIPIERTGGALTVGPKGLDYRLITRLLFETDYEGAAAQQPRGDDPADLQFVASTLVRGQGKTDGLHERVLHIHTRTRPHLFDPAARAALGQRATTRVERVALVRSKVLFPALKQLAGGSTVFPDRLDEAVDEVFFDHLFATADWLDDAARIDFDRELTALARVQLEWAIARSGLIGSRRFKAVSAAERMFRGCLAKHCPDLTPSGTAGIPSEGAHA